MSEITREICAKTGEITQTIDECNRIRENGQNVTPEIKPHRVILTDMMNESPISSQGPAVTGARFLQEAGTNAPYNGIFKKGNFMFTVPGFRRTHGILKNTATTRRDDGTLLLEKLSKIIRNNTLTANNIRSGRHTFPDEVLFGPRHGDAATT